jgi:hypothetical protein
MPRPQTRATPTASPFPPRRAAKPPGAWARGEHVQRCHLGTGAAGEYPPPAGLADAVQVRATRPIVDEVVPRGTQGPGSGSRGSPLAVGPQPGPHREAAEVTQQQLADHLGAGRVTIVRAEQGTRAPTLDLADELGATIVEHDGSVPRPSVGRPAR